MNVNSNSIESTRKLCGYIVLAGAVINAIALFTFVSYAFKAESSNAFYFLIRSLASTAGYAIIGAAIFTEKYDLIKWGLFSVGGSFVLSTYMPLVWIKSNADYYGSITRANGANFVCLLICLAGAAGFIIMGIVFSNKTELQQNNNTVAVVFLGIYIALEAIYAIYATQSFGVTMWTYLSNYIPGAGAMAIVGAIGAIMLPYAFPDEMPANESTFQKNAQQPDLQESVQKNTANDLGITVEVATSNNDQLINEPEKSFADSIELLKKYKQLLDMGIMTPEEFAEKKKQIL